MWINDVFYYSVGNLKGIAEHYESLYTNASLAALYYVAESKADFDRSLDGIGRGKWDGKVEGKKFPAFKYFGRLQQVILADLYGVTDKHLEAMGFYDIPRLRGMAYSRMVEFINKGGN